MEKLAPIPFRAAFAALFFLAGGGLALSSCSGERRPPAAAASEEDANLGLRLGLLEGHLQIGRELIDAGQTQNALPHFGHPVRELYGDLRPVLAARGAEQFEGELVRLESLAALEPRSPNFTRAFDAALAKVSAARLAIPEATRSTEAYALHLTSDLATIAAQEYRNALVAGRIGSLVEYHDARGFVSYAASVLAERATNPSPDLTQATDAIARLRAMLAPLDPPSPPLATDAQFEAQAARLRELVREQ